MPTPFMHLQIAESIKVHSALGQTAQEMMASYYPAFCLGNVAPDYQTICDVPRENSHFYRLPPEPGINGYPKMLLLFPELANSRSLSPDHALFIGAYCAHLMLDLQWYHEVLVPYFVLSDSWSDHRQRFLVHNTLLTYLDQGAVRSLPSTMGVDLAAAEPENWLPFAEDRDLIRWRDLLVEQLQPGADLQTVNIYARRLMMDPREFAANLQEPGWLAENLYARVPVEKVRTMLAGAVEECIRLINEYLEGNLQGS